MRSRKISAGAFIILCLLLSSIAVLAAADTINALKTQLQSLERQKKHLEDEKQKLIEEGNTLADEIEYLKLQSRGGLGIIGRYRLSRKLRKAQTLSDNIQVLEKRIYVLSSEMDNTRNALAEEYKHQSMLLILKLTKARQETERKELLEKLNEYQAAREKLTEPQERKIVHLDISKIQVRDYDGPQEIREKANLIDDFGTKVYNEIDRLSAQIAKLQDELRTRERLGEFAEEVSFFGERVAKEEIGTSKKQENSHETAVTPNDRHPNTLSVESVSNGKTADSSSLDAQIRNPADQVPEEAKPNLESAKVILERSGVSADFTQSSLNQLRTAIALLQKRQDDLKREFAAISRKAEVFYEKADEVEKSEIKTTSKRR